MIRRLEGPRPAFALETTKTSYIFRVLPSGHLMHLYYGPKLPISGFAQLEALTEKRVRAPGNSIVYSPEHPELALEDTMLEFSAAGHGDLREPFLELVFADGSRTPDFLYVSSVIAQDAPVMETLPGAYGSREHLIVTCKDASRGLTLKLRWSVFADCDCIVRAAVLVNESGEAVSVERLLSSQLDLPGTWAVTSFHGAWAREMAKTTVPLPAGKFVVESRCGSSSNRCNPFFMVHSPDCTEEAGECYGLNLIYSGSHYAAVEVSAFGKTRVVQGIQPALFRWHLDSGETLEAPEAVLTYSAGGFAGESRNMHAFVREHIVRGEWQHRPRPILLNSWEACYFDISEDTLLSLAGAGKEAGAELFVMDDGWFGERNDDTSSLGDWDPNPKKLPGGLRSLGEKVRALGLDFGLWVESEMVSVNSRLYEAHPDWALGVPGEEQSEGRTQRILDLGNPAVQDYLIEKMTEIFRESGVSYVKWDYNRVVSDGYSSFLPPQRQGEAAHRCVCGLYRVMSVLNGRFPHVLFEGCASGGGRFDLGILCFFPQIWASDDTDAICRASIQEGYSYGYPMSVLSAHVSASPNHQTRRETDLSTRFHVAAFGLLGYELDIRRLSQSEREEIRAQTRLYREWREVLQFGTFRRVRSGNTHCWTCVSPDGRKAVGMLLQELAEPEAPMARFYARGLIANADYRFHTLTPEEDCVLSGESLMRAGASLKQPIAAPGREENVRFWPDFASRLYFMEVVK